MRLRLLATLALLSTIAFSIVNAQDIATTLYPYIYKDLSNWPCVRLLNATGTIGCQVLNSATGILQMVQSQTDLNNFISSGGLSGEKYAIVMPYGLMTTQNLRNLGSSNKLGGVIAIVNTTLDSGSVSRPQISSPDSTCPNCEFGLYANDSQPHVWNPQGTSLIYENFDFPIFALDPIDPLSVDMYNTIALSANYNANKSYTNYPLKAVEFNAFMYGAVNTATCLRRGWCSPVGGLSVYSTPSGALNHGDGKPVIVLSAAMDSRSFFHDLALGIEHDVSGMIALIAIADALSKSPTNLTTFPKHIIYTVFTAEAWGHAGSQRFVDDISQPLVCVNTSSSSCPYANPACTFPCFSDLDFTRINFDAIESVWELNSVAQSSAPAGSSGFYAHVDDPTLPANQRLVQLLANVSVQNQGGGQYAVQAAGADGVNRQLPPSTVQAFLQKKRAIPAVVLSDFQKQLGNFYNSDLDDTFDPVAAGASICAAANITARAIWLQAQGLTTTTSVPGSVAANCSLVEALLGCLTTNYSCPYVTEFYNSSNAGRITHYTSIYNFNNPGLIPLLMFNILGNLTASYRGGKCTTIADCSAGQYCITQQCVNTLTRYHDAYGTGLQMNVDGSFSVVDPTKGTWAESVWDQTDLRVFIVISRNFQIVELVVGIVWTALSVGLVLYTQRFLVKTLKVA